MTNKTCRYLLGMMLFGFGDIVPASAEAASHYWAPWVTRTTTNAATINWRGASNGVGVIYYATESYYNGHQSFDKTITSQTMTNYQHVQLTGLEPDTAYIYKVSPSGNENLFSNRTFRTMPASGPFTFIVISDSQEGHNYTEVKRFKYVAEAVARETNVLFILHGGDYAGHDSRDLWTTFFQVADGMLAKFAIFPAIGNHEYHNGGATNGPTAADQYHWAFEIDMNRPLNYAFDCSGIRFVILDSPDPNNANGDDPQTSLALAQSQAPWLSNLLDNAMSGTFTMHHHPIWDNGRTNINSNLEPWENLYHMYPISATFAGHTHNYQRFLVEGIPYFIVGIAGGRCADISITNPACFQFGETRKLGYLKVSVNPANNTATAQEIVAASVEENDSDETPHVYDPPLIDDTVTFPLKISLVPPYPSGPSGASGDYDGDRLADPTVFWPAKTVNGQATAGDWQTRLSRTNYARTDLLNFLGTVGDMPAPADYDGDRLCDPAVYQASNGTWQIKLSASGYAPLGLSGFGAADCQPAAADYDGDGRGDVAIYQAATGNWAFEFSSADYAPIVISDLLGGSGTVAVSADYDGDGKADPAVYGSATGTWQILLSGAGYSKLVLANWLGRGGFRPAPGDYDGDRKADPTVFEAATGAWQVRQSGADYNLMTLTNFLGGAD